ncbi:MAG: FYVE zinc finger domain-containing protein [bacterium]
MNIHNPPTNQEERLHILTLVRSQFRELTGTEAGVTCASCQRKVPVRFMYHCFNCGLWFCHRCSGEHFATGATTWNPMATAPRTAQNVRVMMSDGTVHEEAHWASDKSGEDQPPFEGWFVAVRSEETGAVVAYRGIPDPVGWQPPRGEKR